MMDGRCETCKWYESEANIYNGEPDWGRCQRGESEDGEALDSDTLVMAYDQEEYHAMLRVRVHFGCVMYEARE